MNTEDIRQAFAVFARDLCSIDPAHIRFLDESAPFPEQPGLYIRVEGGALVTQGDTLETNTGVSWTAQSRHMESGSVLIQTVGRAAEDWLKHIAGGIRMRVGPALALREAGIGIQNIARSRNLTSTGLVGMLPLHEQRFSFYAMHHGCVVSEPGLDEASKVVITTTITRDAEPSPVVVDTTTTTVDVS